MPWIAPVIGAIGSVASGAIGAASSASDRNAAMQAYEQSVKDLEAIGVPSVQAQQITMQQYQSAGKWTPELEQAVKLGDSNMLGISTDGQSVAAQKQALAKLQEIGDSGGQTLEDKAHLERTMGDINASERGRREAILQDANQRGGYGNGTSLVAQLVGDQGAANREHMAGIESEAQSQKRALEAIQGAGQLGGNIRAQDFGEKSQTAQAQDAIARWNAANQQAVQGTNTGYANESAKYNLNNEQNRMNANTDLANKQEVYNKGLYQQEFNDNMAKQGAKANARAGQASNLNNNANQTSQMWGGIGSAVAQGGAAAGQMMNSNEQRALDRSAKVNTNYVDYDPNKQVRAA